ncbi:MAG: type II secretion system F family protein [Deltaproteobacteria bacterium]|nr:MAG: type II secretion system F family protein [Deltaproteobacteria bacterium]
MKFYRLTTKIGLALTLLLISQNVGSLTVEERKAIMKKTFQECRDGEQRKCYEVGEYYEKKGAYKKSISIFKKACSRFNPKGIDKACEKLKYGEKEVFDISGFSGAKRSRSFKYIRECRRKAYAGCFNLGLLYEESAKEQMAKSLIQRACKGGVESACYKLRGDQSSQIIFWASIFLIGLVCFIVANAVLSKEEAFKATEIIGEENAGEIDYKKFGSILSYSRPFFVRYFSPIVAGLKGKKKLRERYKRPLARAGLTEALTPEDFFAFKLFLIIAFPIVFIGIRQFLDETWPLTLIPVLAGVGFIYPNIWANGLGDARQKEIIMSMPFAVDMLALSVEAGLDFIAAMAKVTEKARPSALVDEFNLIQKEIKIGATRAEALRKMAWRVDMIPITSFTATLIAADSVGANIGPILKNLSVEIRQKKSAEAEKQGATAATKILFPMLFLIVPAVFIVVAAPIALELIIG